MEEIQREIALLIGLYNEPQKYFKFWHEGIAALYLKCVQFSLPLVVFYSPGGENSLTPERGLKISIGYYEDAEWHTNPSDAVLIGIGLLIDTLHDMVEGSFQERMKELKGGTE